VDCGGIVVTSSGDIYIVMGNDLAKDVLELFYSSDNGVTWRWKQIAVNVQLISYACKAGLVEYTTDRFLVANSSRLILDFRAT
jgi:hypothetical protein